MERQRLYIAHIWLLRGSKKIKGRHEREKESRESSGRQVRQKKNIPVLGEITAPDLVTASQCADVTMYKRSMSPMISNSLTMAARALHGVVRWARDRYNKMGYCVWMGLRRARALKV